MMIPKRAISWTRVMFALIAIVISATFAYFLQPKYHNNSNALAILATVFSILAGFLIAVLAMVADQRSLRGSNWRQDVVYLEIVRSDLRRHRRMFHLYLVVLCLAFVGAIDPPLPAAVKLWVERILLFLAFFAMTWSFRLPGYLTNRHLRALEQLVKSRRDEQTR